MQWNTRSLQRIWFAIHLLSSSSSCMRHSELHIIKVIHNSRPHMGFSLSFLLRSIAILSGHRLWDNDTPWGSANRTMCRGRSAWLRCHCMSRCTGDYYANHSWQLTKALLKRFNNNKRSLSKTAMCLKEFQKRPDNKSYTN